MTIGNMQAPKLGTRKVTVGTLSAAASTVIIYLVGYFSGEKLDPAVSGAIATIVMGIFVYLTTENVST